MQKGRSPEHTHAGRRDGEGQKASRANEKRKGKAAPEPEKGKGIDSMEYQHILAEKHGKALGVLEILKIAAEYAGCLLCTL